MRVGSVTVDGLVVGSIEVEISHEPPEWAGVASDGLGTGRADRGIDLGGSGDGFAPGYGGRTGPHEHAPGHGHRHGPGAHGRGSGAPHEPRRHGPGRNERPHHIPGTHGPAQIMRHGHAPRAGSGDTDAAIRGAAKHAGVDPNTMRSIASIESSMNPASNANRRTQYKGLYQIGREEWQQFGSGDVYNAHDNAMAAARMFKHHKAEFNKRFGRDPTDRELYMIHQQGLGFYTRGAMTNIGGNRYPGMRGPQTHESFEAGWGREVERRKAHFATQHRDEGPKAEAAAPKPEASAEKPAANDIEE
jgi:hypothetical protein